MPAPYSSEEVARAVNAATRQAGLPLERLEVIPDVAAQVWIIRAAAPGATQQHLIFPFASPRGIYTPAEIAAHLVEQSWPFGG